MTAPRANPAQIAPGEEAGGQTIGLPFVGADPHPIKERGERLNDAFQVGQAAGRF